MRWKGLLTLIVILGLAGLLLATPTGKKFSENLRGLVPGLVSLLQPAPSGKYFTILLTANKEAFYGQAYQVSNTTFTGLGICQGSIELNDILLDKNIKRCTISLDDTSGRFDYTSVGSVKLSAKVSKAVIDDETYSSSDGLKVGFEIIPEEFFLIQLNERKIPITISDGELKKFKEDGSLEQTVDLSGKVVEISGFIGSMRLDENTVTLRGLATQVKVGETVIK